ncbi:MAG: histidine kinase dimerization/phosphoacceptor domain -containing protein [Deltaproteobacteria bacterium]|nr:histidine kinase dimerization/phosphoacceptor domain -containing protein [Deltaproteobacteria bacterium]
MDRTRELASANEELKIQIAVRNRAENRLIIQHLISKILADSTSLAVATPRIVRAVCENLGWDMGAIWMIDKLKNVLCCIDYWHLSSIDVPEFEAITRGYKFSHGEGMPGRIWASGKPEWITEVAGDPSFLRAVYAERAGIHSLFGFPIKLGGDILGVIEFLSMETLYPDKDIMDIFDLIGSQIGQFAERKLAEEQVRASLMEKEVLLHEVYHRVKNNMQVISSMLSLQSRYTKDNKASELFLDCRNRIRSMALVHEMLYQSDNLAKINSKYYIKNLLDGIMSSYREYAGNINVDVSLDEISLKPDSAIPLGFIINELVVNSIKHAFPQDRIDKKKEIKIEFRSIAHDMMALIVKDNGVGLSEDIDVAKSESIGLKLVNLLVRQMEGKIQILRKDGTDFRIEFNGRNL